MSGLESDEQIGNAAELYRVIEMVKTVRNLLTLAIYATTPGDDKSIWFHVHSLFLFATRNYRIKINRRIRNIGSSNDTQIRYHEQLVIILVALAKL